MSVGARSATSYDLLNIEQQLIRIHKGLLGRKLPWRENDGIVSLLRVADLKVVATLEGGHSRHQWILHKTVGDSK